jgi:hypothetical protein
MPKLIVVPNVVESSMLKGGSIENVEGGGSL